MFPRDPVDPAGHVGRLHAFGALDVVRQLGRLVDENEFKTGLSPCAGTGPGGIRRTDVGRWAIVSIREVLERRARNAITTISS